MRRALPALAAALFAWHAPPLGAQDLSVRVGGLHARYADSLSGTAGSLAGRLVLDAGRFRAASTLSLAQFLSGDWAAQLGASALGLKALGRAFSIGALGEVNGSWLQGGTLSGTATAGPLLAVGAGPWLGSLSGSVGGLRRIDGSSAALVGATARMRHDFGAVGVSAAVSFVGAGAVHYRDVTLGADASLAAFSGSVVAGARSGDLGGGPWLQAQAAWRIGPSWALEVEGGKYPEDVAGFTHGLYVTAGIRLGLTPGALDPRVRRRSGSDDMRIERAGGGRVRVVFRVPGAREVAIAGEWNGWDNAPLTARPDGRWETVVQLRPGAYRFSLVVDGERWTVPAGVPSMSDDFGGRVGLLVVGS
ncbi:MAG: glycogen-binding domain-containing protein [Gemmatimonadales bacterium]